MTSIMKIKGKEITVDDNTICKNCKQRAGKHHYYGGNCPSDEDGIALIDSRFEAENN